ncbi:MAG: site-specific integrase [Furfurilactobacillus sp.]|uniref:site-specific integrase n=1 Tax=Furfurilactobacillus sp. TaxID=2767911 RepID=UPI00258F1F2C|nr:site-specific integrase [Furfurilactobacillus sp.]MCH4010577.1 site-specific integrase [Furfurilactobacillus sp.]MCH4036469.1 site-specific integrase [Furfurilactobacillus sp.]MCH4114585.1 site-specific integrase [Furfurilactobacillus sp.]MCH4133796.1 site-specific integrase [Furfurilactobacillus sp.]MCI1340167.1 site-specific integrase [Furfurilactobacillus sp.]
MSFAEYFEWWTDTYKNGRISAITLKKYFAHAKWLKTVAPNMMLHDLDSNRPALQWLLDQYGKNHRHKTVLDFKVHVMESLKSAQDDGLVKTVPKSRLIVPSVESTWSVEHQNEVRNTPKVMTEAEYRMFKSRTDFELGNMLREKPIYGSNHTKGTCQQFILADIVFLTHTGARFAESLGFKKSDIHEDDGYVDINKTWNYRIPEGGYMPTKNESSVRHVVVDESLIGLMDSFSSWKNKNFGTYPDIPLLVQTDDAKPHNATYNRYLKGLLREYGVKENQLSIHKLRHTYISYLLTQGISPEMIAKQVGHTDTNMIMSVYGHLMAEKEQSDKLKMQSLMS